MRSFFRWIASWFPRWFVFFFLSCCLLPAQDAVAQRSQGGGQRSSAPAPATRQAAPTPRQSPWATNTRPQNGFSKPTGTQAAPSRWNSTNSAPAVATASSSHHNRLWWGYWGPVNGFGWGYPAEFYPNWWYWNGVYGYQFQYSHNKKLKTGIDFDLRLLGSEYDAALRGTVYLPRENSHVLDQYGPVENFLSSRHHNHVLRLRPGSYDITIVLADGKKIVMSVAVQPDTVTTATPSFTKPPQLEQAEAHNKKSGGEAPKLVPAAPPADKPE